VYPSVSYEGAAYWLTRVNPIRVRDLIAARFLFNLPIMLLLGLGLGLAAALVLDLSPVLALAAPVAAVCAAIATTGLAVGMGAANPRFHFTNPNELVMTPGALAFMTLASGQAALTGILFARPAWMAMRGSGDASYWLAPEGLLVLALLLMLTLAVTLLPLSYGARRLQRSEH
jgi:ABC-2 type transport system permease protein